MPKAGESVPMPLRGWESGGDVPGSMGALVNKLYPLYMERVRPLEEMYKFDNFQPNWFDQTIQNERPLITLFGPWSAGKTTFINYLLQSNHLWTGPQPTTAQFTVVMHGQEPGPIDGQGLANSKALPFKGLLDFGDAFIHNLKGYQIPHALLERVTIVDTPGVLESASEIHQRKYDYIKVCRWFAERSDLIFVFFDPTKLSAGAELRLLFQISFKGIENRLRLVLNKADTISSQELMRVYGGLFWNLSNFINTTEPPRVYVGSFWDQPYGPSSFSLLFAEEKADLLHEVLEVIPQQAKDRKIASLLRRAKEVLVHAVIIGGIRAELPLVFGKAKAKEKARQRLPERYESVGAQLRMNHRDFPPVNAYRAFLKRVDVEKFPSLKKAEKAGLIRRIQELIDSILPSMLRPVRNTAAANPFDAEDRRSLLNMYQNQVRSQLRGEAGTQDSSDIVAPALRQVVPAPVTASPSSIPVTVYESNPASHPGRGSVTPVSSVMSSSTTPSHQATAASALCRTSLPPSQSTDVRMLMSVMQEVMASAQQNDILQVPRNRNRPASPSLPIPPFSSASPSEAYFAESSVTPTPRDADGYKDLYPPTEVPQPRSLPERNTHAHASVRADVSKPHHGC